MHFFAKKFGQFKKKQYLCTRFREIECRAPLMRAPKTYGFWVTREKDAFSRRGGTTKRLICAANLLSAVCSDEAG